MTTYVKYYFLAGNEICKTRIYSSPLQWPSGGGGSAWGGVCPGVCVSLVDGVCPVGCLPCGQNSTVADGN